ncbi:MAG: hypothetical protein ACLFTR_03135 [Candidatus Woesearchaeota archaeon]
MSDYNNSGEGEHVEDAYTHGSTGDTRHRRPYMSKLGRWAAIGTAAVTIAAGSMMIRSCSSEAANQRARDAENAYQTEEAEQPDGNYNPSEENEEKDERTSPDPEREQINNIDDLLADDNHFKRDGELNVTLKYHEDGNIAARELYGLGEQDMEKLFQFYEGTGTFYNDGTAELEREIDSYRTVSMPVSDGELHVVNPGYDSQDKSTNLEKILARRRTVELDDEGQIVSETEGYRLDDEGLSEGMLIFADDDENITELSNRFSEWEISDTRISEESTYSMMIRRQDEGYKTVISIPQDGRGAIIQAQEDISITPSVEATRIGGGDETVFNDYEPEESREPSRTDKPSPERRRDSRDSGDRDSGFSGDAQGPTDRPSGRDNTDDGMGGRPSSSPREITGDRETRDNSRDQGNDRRESVDRRVIER